VHQKFASKKANSIKAVVAMQISLEIENVVDDLMMRRVQSEHWGFSTAAADNGAAKSMTALDGKADAPLAFCPRRSWNGTLIK
jgi:hypothetical protein